MIDHDFQLAWHVGDDYPEWGSRPRKPLVALDMAHKGELLESVVGPDVVTGAPMVYHILRCELCIAIHVWPLPSEASLKQYYERQFYEVDKPDYIARYETDRAWWEKCVHDRILDTCQAHLRLDDAEEEQRRFLDIGAGPGISVDCAKRRGWDVLGIEPSFSCARRLEQRGHRVWSGTLASFLGKQSQNYTPRYPEQFHILYAYEVLEHQCCPEDFLLRCHDLLVQDGVLVIVVPNDWSQLQMAACAKLGLPHYFVAPPQHLWMFTPKCLQLLLRRCGYDILDLRGTFAMERFLLDGWNYVGHEEIGRACHQKRMADELHAVQHDQWPEVEARYRRNLAERREGREIIAVCRRRD